jgi:hypothetical protein
MLYQWNQGCWLEIKNHKEWIEWAREQLGVKELDDWYKFSFSDIINIGGGDLFVCVDRE